MGTLMLGITPTIFLHRLAANHRDAAFTDKNKQGPHISKVSFHCNLESSVAHSPFIFIIAAPVYITVLSVAPHITIYKNNFFSRHHFYCELRGPPSC